MNDVPPMAHLLDSQEPLYRAALEAEQNWIKVRDEKAEECMAHWVGTPYYGRRHRWGMLRHLYETWQEAKAQYLNSLVEDHT